LKEPTNRSHHVSHLSVSVNACSTHCNILQCSATYCNTLQRTANNTLQHNATRCAHTATHNATHSTALHKCSGTTHCNTLNAAHAAACCTLQNFAHYTRCNTPTCQVHTLQHTCLSRTHAATHLLVTYTRCNTPPCQVTRPVR